MLPFHKCRTVVKRPSWQNVPCFHGYIFNFQNAGNITLPGTGLYSVEITAYDKAGNSRSGRRLVISDEESKVETTTNSVLRVTSAAEASSWEWQWTSDSVNIDWENRYINTLHHGNKWLEAAIPVSNVDTVYDDNDFSRGVKHVPNVQGENDFSWFSVMAMRLFGVSMMFFN